MASNLRFIIFRTTLLILFAVSLFFVLFLANGYKYDFITNQIRRTGIINVSFQGKDAQVYLDGQKLEGTLPFVASNILPGKYNLILSKAGFWDWNKEIQVNENFITKVDDVLLYPIDEHSVSKVLLNSDDLKSTYFLRDGYFFKIDGVNLFYAQLNVGMTENDLNKIRLPLEGLLDVKVLSNKALLSFTKDKSYILDLISGDLKVSNSTDNLIYGFDKWIYFKGKLLAIFDLNFKNVLFVEELVDGEIEEVQYLNLDSQPYLLVKMKSQNGMTLYRYANLTLVKIVDKVASIPILNGKGDLLILNTVDELWQINLSKKSDQLLARFSQKINLIDLAFNSINPNGQLVWKKNNDWYIGDLSFHNVKQMFKENKIVDLNLVKNNQVYYLEIIKTDSEDRIRLMEMDLDI